MQQASEALARMDYLLCESLCEAALAEAKHQRDWAYYARILMPLQECRRQRRMIAAEGIIRLGTSEQGGGPSNWLNHLSAGCIVITHPHTHLEAARFQRDVRERQLFVEVLFADNRLTDAMWKITTFNGPHAFVALPAPPEADRDRWIVCEAGRESGPANWFIDASQRLGDAMLQDVKSSSPVQRIDALEACLLAAPDHEILHQSLADAAKAARLDAVGSEN